MTLEEGVRLSKSGLRETLWVLCIYVSAVQLKNKVMKSICLAPEWREGWKPDMGKDNPITAK